MNYTNDLAFDLSARRGGNKDRLVARCYVATCEAMDPSLAGLTNAEAYEEFYQANAKKTFKKLHNEFDHVLPVEFHSK
tara:strand:+ start:90 stop:323 length:234 start_codon:yes stop_codon:yes gene_type:complete